MRTVCAFLLALFSVAAQTPSDGVVRYDKMTGSPSLWDRLKNELGWVVSSRPFDRSVALLVGVGDYSYLDPSLKYVAKDLDQMRKFLLDKGGFDTVFVVKDKAVTTSLLERYMFSESSPLGLTSRDRLLFYFSGHGTDKAGHGYLQFAKAKPLEFDSDQYLDVTRIEQWSKNLTAKDVLFLVDACNSGLGFDEKAGVVPRVDQDLLNVFTGEGSRVLITAGTSNEKAFQVSAANNQGYSVFTRAFLDSLDDSNSPSGFLIVDEVMSGIRRRVAEFCARNSGLQMTPRLWHLAGNRDSEKGTFIFMSAKTSSPILPSSLSKYVSVISKENEPSSAAAVGVRPVAPQIVNERSIPTLRNAKDNLVYVWIPAGSFTMGCSIGDLECSDNEKPAHQVFISKGYWMGQSEVTQSAFQHLVGPLNGDAQQVDPKLNQVAVETSTWRTANSYCAEAGGRLPTEAEWEYAARGGSASSRFGELEDIAVRGNNEATRIAQKKPNAFGLYDTLGGVKEWVADWYSPDYSSADTIDPRGPSSRSGMRVLRGGSRSSPPKDLRVSAREPSYDVDWREGEIQGFSPQTGLRCVLDSFGFDGATQAWLLIAKSRRAEDFDEFSRAFPSHPLAVGATIKAAQLRRLAAASKWSLGVTPQPGETRVNPKDGLEYLWIPGGPFQFEAPCGSNRDCSSPTLKVAIVDKGFWVGKREVNQGAFQRVNKKSSVPAQPGEAATNLSWQDAHRYCKSVGMSLPTRIQFEHVESLRFSELDDQILPTGQISEEVLSASHPFGLEDISKPQWTSDMHTHSSTRSCSSKPSPWATRVPTGRSGTSQTQYCTGGGSYKTYDVFNGTSELSWVKDKSIGFRCIGDQNTVY